MSETVDQRTVEMKFDESRFGAGVKSTLGHLESLKKALKLDGATKGIENVEKAGKKVDLSHISNGVVNVGKQFSAMSVVGVTALATVANRAVTAGMTFAKSFSFGPIMAGFSEYELKLGSIQTILANTAKYGTSLSQVNASLDQLNTYADKTIYNFGDMTKNIGLFTNAGIRVEDATSMIKGFSNAAAASGTSAQGAAGAAYQLSQALSSGQIRLMDWRSLTNVGMGNKNMQEDIIRIADAMGTLDKAGVSAKTVQGDFNKSLEKGWLSSDVMTKYLKIMGGEMSATEMKALGLTDAQIKGMLKTQKTAEEAATKVRTLSQLLGTMKEAIGSGWSESFQLLFGNFDEATALFTSINNAVSGFIGKMSDSRNQLIGQWKFLGGRDVLLLGLKEGFQGILSILKPLQVAFRQIFPKKTAYDLMAMTMSFREFMRGLKIGAETADNLKRTFRGVFALFDIGKQIVVGLFGMFQRLFGSVSQGSGGFLKFTGNLGDFITKLDIALKKGGGITAFFDKLGDGLAVPLNMLKNFASALGDLFEGKKTEGGQKVSDSINKVGSALALVKSLGDKVQVVMGNIANIFRKVGDVIENALAGIGSGIAKAFSPAVFDRALATVNTGLFAGLVVILRKFSKDGLGVNADIGGGFFAGIKDALGTLTETMEAMQMKIKADAIMRIAIALGILTASVVVLAMIDGDKLVKAMTALGVGLVGLGGALQIMSTAFGSIGAAKLPFITASLMALAGALLLLSFAVKVFASMDMFEILRGLTGIALTLVVVTRALEPMSKNHKGLIRAATAIGILGVALNILGVALKIFATMSWEEMAKGLTVLTASLTSIAATMRVMPKDILLQSVAIGALAIALNGIGLAMKLFATMKWEEMAKGFAGIVGSLTGIAIAMRLMPMNMVLQATALVLIAGALNVMGGALKIFATMSWTDIAKGLATLAGSLIILAVGLNAMSGALPGAAALLVAAGALAVLTPVLVTLGSLEWETIIKSLVSLAGIFVVLGLAGLVLAPLTPVILGLSVALLAIGAGLILVGGAAMLFATAFGIIVSAGSAGLKTLAGILTLFIANIPATIKAFGLGLVELIKALGKAAPEIIKSFTALMVAGLDAIIKIAPKIAAAFVAIVGSILDTVITIAPKIAVAFLTLVNMALVVLQQAIPRMAMAGLNILLGVLSAINANIFRVVVTVGNIIVNFIKGITIALPKIIDAGVKMIIAFVEGLARAIRENSEAMGRAGGDLAVAIVEGMVKGLKGGAGRIASAAKEAAKGALTGAMKFLGIHSPSKEFEKVGKYIIQGLAKGITGNRDQITASYNTVKELLQNAMKSATEDAAKAAARLKTLTEARLRDQEAIRKAVVHLNELKSAKEKDNNAIVDAQNKLAQLTRVRDKDNAAIKEAQQALAAANRERKISADTYVMFTQKLNDETGQLQKLADAYDKLTTQVDEANKSLDDAIRTRDDYSKSLEDQFGSLPDISKETTFVQYIEDIKQKITDTQNFTAAIQQLRNLGLSDEMYKDLLMRGLDALPFVQELVEGGEESVKEINALGTKLGAEANTLGAMATRELYQAGVDAAQGLVDGLKVKQNDIRIQMEAIAAAMIKALKKSLGIKSPSVEFFKMGVFSVQGLAKGLNNSSAIVERAAEDIGDHAVEAVKKTLTGLSDVLIREIDVNPTIRPVLDLTDMQKEAGKIGSLLSIEPISLETTYATARNASAGYTQNQEARVEVESPVGSTNMTFVQNNTSPKALSPAEIYRQTNNQLSVAKGALTKNA